jgi:tetratricopeptide (TPR) repeat protein
MSSGSAVRYDNVTVDHHSISISLEALVPNEVLTISAMLNGIAEARPRLSVRSTSSVGEPWQLISDGDKAKWPVIKGAVAPIITFGWLGALYWIWRRRRFEIFRNVNDFAFLYIHQGLVKEAEEVLRQHINRKGASAFELLNYGLALALTGTHNKSQKYFAAGEWLAKSNYVRGLAEFNKSIAYVAAEDMARARGHLKEAFKLSVFLTSLSCG